MKKKVVVCGTFDGLDDEHRYFFTKAKEYGDLLYVAVIADSIVLRNKEHLPSRSQNQRAIDLMAEELVYSVIKLPGDDNRDIESILSMSPQVYCFGHDQKEQSLWNEKLEQRLSTVLSSSVEFYTIDKYSE